MKWIVLCVSNDAASLLLYQSILQLGHYVLVAADIDKALKVTKAIAVDCVVVDCEDHGISVTTEIARARPELPILFVSDQSEVQLRVTRTFMMAKGSETAANGSILKLAASPMT
jgi:DNA-binding response OmpR family regulator